MAATSPTPADVLAAVAVSRQDDGWLAARALLMLYPTPGPWRSALPQVQRLLAGRPGEKLLSAFAEVPAKAVRMLVKHRAAELGLTEPGADRPHWLDRLDISEQQATESARAASATLRRGKDVPAIQALLVQIATLSTGRPRRLFDSLATLFAAGHRVIAADSVSTVIDDLLADVEGFQPKHLSRDGEEPFLMNVEDVFSINGRGTVVNPKGYQRRIRGVRVSHGQDDVLAEAMPRDDEPTAALSAGEPPPPDSTVEPAAVPRRLQVQITDVAANQQRHKAFRPGVQHKVEVTLSPDILTGHLVGSALNEKAVEFSTPDDGGPDVAELMVQFICDVFGKSTPTTKPLRLPRTGASTPVSFDLIVDAEATTVKCSVLLFQGSALLQSAVITGPVSARDRTVDGVRMRIVAEGQFVAVVGPAPALQAHPVQASVSTHVGHRDDALVVSDQGRAASIVTLTNVAEVRGQITDALRTALDADSLSTTAAGRRHAAAAQVRLMRSLAKFGNILYQKLPPAIKALGQQDSVQLICGDDDIVPFEIVYDYGFPHDRAKLCPEWQKALRDGRCTCTPIVGTVATICPLGFWGLRLVIERQVADSSATEAASAAGLPSPGRHTLPSMNRVLFAASQRVDSGPGDSKVSAIDDTVAALTERLGKANVAYVKTWKTWRSTVERTRPGLILSLPHNERDSDNLPRLEIGRQNRLTVGALDCSYVLGTEPAEDQVGPVVFLLGCNTANESVPWYSAAAAFRSRGASVVVGTLCEALGRQTAPMTRLLADLLWGAPGAGQIQATTLGDIMLLIRRRLVAEGMTLGMSLVAFGHAGWMLSDPTPPVPAEK